MKRQGSQAEDQAASYLQRRGWRVLARNYRTPSGEIDIIAMDAKTLVFIEVKSRGRGSLIAPSQAVDDKKQRRIANAAYIYMSTQLKPPAPPARFDVIAIGQDGKIEHIADAFEASPNR